MLFRKIFIVLHKNEVNRIPNDAENVFCRSDYLKHLISKRTHNLITPNPKETSIKAKELLFIENKISDLIVKKTIKNNTFSGIQSFEELLKPFLVARISSYLYMKSVIPDSQKYFVYGKWNWKLFDNKEDAIIQIEKKLSEENDSSHYFLKACSFSKANWLDSILGNIQGKLLKKYLKKINQLSLITDKKSYYFNHLTYLLKKNNKDIIYPYLGTNRIKYTFCIIKLFSYFFRKKKLYTGIFLIPENFNLDYNYQYYIEKEINSQNILSKKYSKILSFYLNNYIANTIAYYKYINSLFLKVDTDIRIISHAKRFPKTFALTEALENLGHKNYLISHGTHSYQALNEIDKLASHQLALGLLFSENENTVLCSQSILADKYLEKNKKTFVKIYPVENQLYKKSQENKQLNADNNEKNLIILHAGTIKEMGLRRYYYHSSSEYIENLRNICNKLKPIRKNIKFIIRIRPLPNEIDIDFLQKVFDEFKDFVEFSNKRKFIEELSNIDCLMALSSTTLEQALINNIPSMSIGETGYDHFSSYSKNNLPNDYNKSQLFTKVENLLGKKFIYLSNFDRGKVLDLMDIIS